MTLNMATCCLVLFFFFPLTHLSCSLPTPHANNRQIKKQHHVLDHLRRAKQEYNSSGIDTTHFDAVHIDVGDKAIVGSQEGMKERDRIHRLPGQPPADFAQYGGHVTVDEVAGRALFYYFVQAPSSKHSSLPLLLWLNGGPGCSSLGYGAMMELGPFRVHSDGKTLYRNRYAWNNAANVVFLESPAGVGFSYTNRTSDFNTTGDRRTAAENYIFMLNWLERFPEYKNRDFYIAGESYAGHFVPQLAHTILYHNNKANKTLINLKGIMIGNAVIHDEMDYKGMFEFLASHGILSDEAAHQMEIHCDQGPNKYNSTKECNAAVMKPRNHQTNNCESYDPCSDWYVEAYLNRAEVQVALHAMNVTKLPKEWHACGAGANWSDSPSSIIPLLHDAMASGLRVWVFSGDIDGRVPLTSTKYAIKMMNLSTKTPWHPWYLDGDVGGYTQEYKGDMTFATVRGAGHQVPSFQPRRALSLITHFLAASPLPNTSLYLACLFPISPLLLLSSSSSWINKTLVFINIFLCDFIFTKPLKIYETQIKLNKSYVMYGI